MSLTRRLARKEVAAPLRLGVGLGLGALACAWTACTPDPEIEERQVVVYSLRSCPVSESKAYAAIYASGDFEPLVERPPTASLFLRDVGTVMSAFPRGTRSLVVDVSEGSVDWRGIADVSSQGPVHVLVWAGGERCRLTRNVEMRDGAAIAVFGRHAMIAGGSELEGASVPSTYVADLSTGAVERLAFGLGARRKHATITAFAVSDDPNAPPGALVAGGQNPDAPDRSGEGALGTAELYVPNVGAPSDVGDFDRTRIELSEPRTDHGGVVLASGETLLVGGLDSASRPMRTMEIVDPKTRKYRTNIFKLRFARARPTVLRLASGEILVAGGVDAGGKPVPALEWFSPDLTRETKRAIDLVAGRERAIVPLDAGGALAVVAPEENAPPGFSTVYVISADGVPQAAIPIDPRLLDTVRLFRGSDGAPILWTGRRWMRWQPWYGVFEPIADAPDVGPKNNAYTNGDPGLALWLEEVAPEDPSGPGLFFTGFRFATRTRFGVVPKPLLVDGPDHLAPDRLAGVPGSSIHFDHDLGLVMGPRASAFLTDVTFADFELDVDVTSAPPVIVLRRESGVELEVGGLDCAFGQSAREHLAVVRKGGRVSVTIDRREERVCPTELEDGARVAIGLRGAEGASPTGARNLVVTRR